MRQLALPTVVLLLLVFSSSIPRSVGEIKSEKIVADPRTMILFEKFGFARGGHVTISVSEVTVTYDKHATPDPALFGFFLISEESLYQAFYDAQERASDRNSNAGANSDTNFCVLSSSYVKRLFTFRDLSPPPASSYNSTFPITTPDEYSLFFASCAAECQVTMSVRTEMYNVQPGGARDYLSLGQSRIPTLYFAFSIAYIAFLGTWIYICLVKNRRFTHRIHLLMGCLVLVRALYLICAAEDQHYIKVTGTPHGWDILFYLFQFLKGVLLFTVIVLIGTGWSFLKPFLQEREKKVLMVVIPLQVVANIASVVIGETGPFNQEWITWKQVFLLVDIICCCAIMFPIVWSIKTLRETSKTDGKAARNLAKLTLFRQFYVVVVGYLYFTRIVVFALKTIAAYKYLWVSVAAEEVATLTFYVFMFHMFRPTEKNEYFAIDDDEEEAAQVALQAEEFEL